MGKGEGTGILGRDSGELERNACSVTGEQQE